MKQKEKITQLTAKHAAEFLRKLQAGKVASEGECNTLISDLKELQQCCIEQKTINIDMQVVTDIENQLDVFNIHANSSIQLLKEMLSVISEGRVPPKQQIKELDLFVDGLRQQYSLIYKAALQQCSAEEIPKIGLPVIEYINALKNCKTVIYSKKFADAQNCLENFVAIKSLTGMYAQQLFPYQQKANQILEKILSGEFVEISAIEEETEGPKVFLKALESENPAATDNGKLIQQISQIYDISPLIIAGIAGKQYFLEPEAMESDVTKVNLERDYKQKLKLKKMLEDNK